MEKSMKVADMKVELLDHMGSDLTVANAARVSFDKESDWEMVPGTDEQFPGLVLSSDDEKLIRYLAKHNHWTPFGHCTLQFRIKAPIFVARQLVKHQVGLVWNEVSRRYVDSEPEFFFPETWRARVENVKQGSSTTETVELYGGITAPRYNSPHILTQLALQTYNGLLADGVAPEQARMILPINSMTEWYWTGSLMAFARVCNLRLDPHAQLETQLVAQMIDDLARSLFPVSWKYLVKNNNN